MKTTKKKTVTETITYHLTDEIKYVKVITNNKETSRDLYYTGNNLYDYGLKPLYNKDLSILKVHNPYWGKRSGFNDETWFDKVNLPEPEDIDLTKIIFGQSARFAFFTLDKKPIPVVVNGDYIEANLNNHFYDLEKLREYLLKHKNVIKCSEILDIPYYNAGDSNGTKYLSVTIYPNSKILQKGYDNKLSDKDVVFYKPYIIGSEDFLKIKKFVINSDY